MKAISNFLSLRKAKKKQDMKERLLKNREAVLNVMSENITGARQCPFLLGEKCIGGMCEFFVEYDAFNDKGKKIKYNKCSINQIPSLLVENLNMMRRNVQEHLKTQELMIAMYEGKKINTNKESPEENKNES